MIASVSWLLPWHSLYGDTYQFWSGVGSDIGELTLIISVIVFGRHINCSVNKPRFCWRIGHPVQGTSFRACHKHHPHGEDGKVSAEDIARYHEEGTHG